MDNHKLDKQKIELTERTKGYIENKKQIKYVSIIVSEQARRQGTGGKMAFPRDSWNLSNANTVAGNPQTICDIS